jgi:hypothetical protein
LKDTGQELFLTKSFACKKAFVYNIFVPAILLKADVKAQQILIPSQPLW